MRMKTDEKTKISRNVILLGFTSFFTDISSEMIYPLIQAFVSLVMISAKTMVGPVLGIIEGIAEATASLLKVYSGYISDRIQKRKPLTIAGYVLSGLSKIIYMFAGIHWMFVLGARFSDRVGKGIRTAPRDAMIAESAHFSSQGRAFGFHRAMDYSGALIGVIICYFISLRYLDPLTKTITSLNAFYYLFLISLIPAFLGVLLLFLVREDQPDDHHTSRPVISLSFKSMDRRLKVFFAAVFIFTLGNSSNQFLLLKTMDAGVGLPDMLLMYMVFNLSTSLLSTPLGSLSDRVGRKKIILAGYLLYSFIYLMFGFVSPATSYFLWVFWILYGVYYALTEGIEKALVSGLAPANRRGTTMGLFNTITGIGLLPASIIAGFLYAWSPEYPFIFGGMMSVTAFIIIVFFLGERKGNG